MGRFDEFDGSLTVEQEEELTNQTRMRGGKKVNKYINEVGDHNLVILDVVDKGPSPFDSTWLNIEVTFANPAGQTTRAFLNVPTKSKKFGQRQSVKEYALLQSFFMGLGLPVVGKTADQDNLRKCFSDPSKLIGLHIQVTMKHKYNSVHAQWNKESKHFEMFDHRGQAVTDSQGNAIVAETRDAIEAQALELGRRFSKGPNPDGFARSSDINDLSKL